MAESLFCPLRQIWVSALPEEKIRQAIIQQMIHHLGYPSTLLAVEKNLNQLPHLQGVNNNSLPQRRADLLVFAKNLHPHHPFYPLLLVECKSILLNQKTLRQLIGYNQFIKAHFIAAANQDSLYLGWYSSEHQDFYFQKGLLPYVDLIKLAHRLTPRI